MRTRRIEMAEQSVVDNDSLRAEEACDVSVRMRRLARAVHLKDLLCPDAAANHERLDTRADLWHEQQAVIRVKHLVGQSSVE